MPFKFNTITCKFDYYEKGITDHSLLSNLSADDHVQYALLAGRSGVHLEPYISKVLASENKGPIGEGILYFNVELNMSAPLPENESVASSLYAKLAESKLDEEGNEINEFAGLEEF